MLAQKENQEPKKTETQNIAKVGVSALHDVLNSEASRKQQEEQKEPEPKKEEVKPEGKEKVITVSFKIKKSRYDDFKALCAKHDMTFSGGLKKLILEALERGNL